MKLSELIKFLSDTMSTIGDRDVYVTVDRYADCELAPVMGGDDEELVLNVFDRDFVYNGTPRKDHANPKL